MILQLSVNTKLLKWKKSKLKYKFCILHNYKKAKRQLQHVRVERIYFGNPTVRQKYVISQFKPGLETTYLLY